MFCDLHRAHPYELNGKATGLAGRNRLSFASGEALPTIGRNRAVNDGAAVDTFPGIKNQKEIGESFQHHHAFAFRTFHLLLLGGDVYSCACSEARAEPNCQV
jgi:hypothetical protein